MNILIVSYLAPPTGGPRSARIANVGHALLRHGHQVQVLTVNLQGKDQRLLDKMAGASFVRVPPGRLEKMANRRGAAGAAPAAAKTERSLLQRIVTPLLLPDRQIEWLLPVLTHRKQLDRPDLVLSFCPHFSSAVAGHMLAKRWGVPHVIDYGDPWSLRVNYELPSWRRSWDRQLETSILAYSRRVVVNTEPHAALVRGAFPETKVTVITNGFDPADYEAPGAAISDELRYLGGLYEIRLPLDPLGAALTKSPDFQRLVAYGDVFHVALPPWVESRRTVDYDAAIGLMKSAKALLVLGNQGGLQIPSKLFTYLGAKRPVLVIVESSADPMLRLDLGPHVVVVENNERAISEGLRAVGNYSGPITLPGQFSWESLGNQYAALLKA